MNNSIDKKKLYIELELRWNSKFGWFLSRSLLLTGVIGIIAYLIAPLYGEKIITGLTGAVVLFLVIHVVLFFREKKLRELLKSLAGS